MRTTQEFSQTTQVRRTRHVGHSWICKDERILNDFLWIPSHRRASISRPIRTYPLCSDTGQMIRMDGGRERERESGKSRLTE